MKNYPLKALEIKKLLSILNSTLSNTTLKSVHLRLFWSTGWIMIIKKLKTQNRPNLLGTSRKLPKEQNSCVHFAQTKIVELSARVSDNWFYTASDCVVSSQSGLGYSLPDVCHQKPETYYLWSSRDSFQAEISFEFTVRFIFNR